MSKGTRTREAILDEAAKLASLVGLNGLTIGTLANHTGMSKSGLFQHFGSKENLQVETLRAGVERFIGIVISPSLKEQRGATRVRALFDNWLRWAVATGGASGCLFTAAAVELDDQPGAARDYLVEHHQKWLEVITRTARTAIEVGDFRTDLDVEQFAFEFHAILLSFHQSARLLRAREAPARAHAMFARLVADASAASHPASEHRT